jgi:hypothetical protein
MPICAFSMAFASSAMAGVWIHGPDLLPQLDATPLWWAALELDGQRRLAGCLQLRFPCFGLGEVGISERSLHITIRQ